MRRTLRIALLIVETVWLGFLVPIHTRGQIAPAGYLAATESRAGAQTATCCEPQSNPAKRDRPPTRARPCAVCQFIATMDLPPALVWIEPPSAPAPELTVVVDSQQPDSTVAWRPDLARAPPARFHVI